MSKTIRTTAVSAVTALAVLAGGAGTSVAAPAKADAAGPKATAAASSCKAWGLRSKFFVHQSNQIRMQIWLVDGQWRSFFRSTAGPTRGTGYYGHATFTQLTAKSIRFTTEWDDDTVRPGIYTGRIDADGYVKGKQTDPFDSRNGSSFNITTALRCTSR